ncbi:MAG: lipopolysaccharide kinase InaA family protein [Gemmatimonadaceae bacterium]
MIRRIPPGYVRFEAGVAEAVAHESVALGVREALGAGSLYAFAAAHPDRRDLTGRLPAYSIPLPNGGPRVVVRRSHHGGWLAGITRDLFVTPTRAPYELLVSLLLGRAGIATPPVLAYATYPAGPILRRSDVATLEVAGADLGAWLLEPDAQSTAERWLAPVADLLKGLTRAGAWHPDLNVKNILLAADDGGVMRAFVLDVDRIEFHLPDDPTVRAANFNRLERSLRKWRSRAATVIDDRLLRHLRELAFAT